MILVLRPEPGASETLARARECGLDARAVPLFEIEPVEWDVPDVGGFDGLLLTSANAARLAGERLVELRGLPVHAVGAATAKAAREAGFDIATSGDDGVERLLRSIEPDLRLLHLCGEDRRAPDKVRQEITPLVVYRAIAIDDPDLDTSNIELALVHSPRAGHRLAELVPDDRRSGIRIAAISEAAATAVGSGWRQVENADQPDDAALLALASRLCHKPPGE
jgi:uroporphyrinogen-III synthase